MRTMGLDVGSKTVGVAVSDGLGWTAQGIETVKINEEQNQYGFKRIGELLKEYEVTKVVVGIPKNMNGTIGPRGEASQFYGNELNKRFGVEVIYWDERLTTIAAERVLLDADVSRKKRKKVIDKMAAVMILQGYLDSQN
ncbi:Holliday junction resolvase RuvX [Cytobacillus sp. FSL W7-1323]|uniref:Putative pre-16S rRNA nuclease n=2 Tax=Cytobacillus TaxID=2675230 RepID=A0A248TL85_9BACI|nr:MULTISPECIES: Holliday junction resolvase RuvX [Cytobacillus]ASV68905.1 Holliday junction resolvase RuvX [Cytobacillus kochii]MBD7935754.1 Holliday junction resolvase RuvX [Cytobacillus stercorigallinarum]MCA1025381.1 Holliday junction resolvase RuvX [Cytobacillus kochii]MCM3324577.1 Holliday junction resolvase RuvX [Cytobacillus kochii]MCM3346970.1 Holliday junction resolvase RuvX [Cytobacillus kochii]